MRKLFLILLITPFLCFNNYCYSSNPEIKINHSLISEIIKDTTITTKVKGITCSSDVKTIQSNIKKIKGVKECETTKQGSVTSFKIKYNTKKVIQETIHSTIENTGGCKNPNDKPYKVKK